MSVNTARVSSLNLSYSQPLERTAVLAASLYFGLGVADLLCSLVAFSYGVAEGNPFMAWLLSIGLFVPTKIFLTVLVTGLILVIYSASHRWRGLVWGSIALMFGIVAFHAWALPKVMTSMAVMPH